MNDFIITQDGSNTLYSKKYNQHFHDVDTGAIKESLTKHVIPALEIKKNSKTLRILDICFGIGYNTFSTIYYAKKNNLNIKFEFYSPEFDEDLIKSLGSFSFPKEFDDIKEIIQEIALNQKYKDDNLEIIVHIGDAREYIKNLSNIDIVYQDAFSAEVNKELWTVEYFKDIYNACNQDAVLTTYSVSTPIRLSLYEAGFFIYEIKPVKKKQTLAFKHLKEIDAKYIDMELKKTRNKEARALYDNK
ncbi:MAG: MnmC family methyltransferase [Campylobacterales bacterium]|nr:MnmC family methyltransferase [Campylobacterales bacterium]